jgi:hypothetical protein
MKRQWLGSVLVGAALLGGLIGGGARTVNAQSDWCMSSVGPMNGCLENYFNMSHDPAPDTVIVPDQPQQPRVASTQDQSQAGPGEEEQPGGQE